MTRRRLLKAAAAGLGTSLFRPKAGADRSKLIGAPVPLMPKTTD